MKIVLFCHSILSDWNHTSAHFLRGVVTELADRGHEVSVYEPEDAWSARNLVEDHGEPALMRVHDCYPGLDVTRYRTAALDLDRALDGADVVLVHDWNEPSLVARVGVHRRRSGRYLLFFHDTHHRAITDPTAMARLELEDYDAVLAFGEVLREVYARRGWARRAFTWHEAADTRVFAPRQPEKREGGLIWIGNWGDGERTTELYDFLLRPVAELRPNARVYGARYPAHARAALEKHGIDYAGWLPNFDLPAAFARHDVTIHIPRRHYVVRLHGIPTIRPFEAMACGIPLLTAPWDDIEGLFTAGSDYWVGRTGTEMTRLLRTLLHDGVARAELAAHARRTILRKHTCAHRVDDLFRFCTQLSTPNARPARSAGASP